MTQRSIPFIAEVDSRPRCRELTDQVSAADVSPCST